MMGEEPTKKASEIAEISRQASLRRKQFRNQGTGKGGNQNGNRGQGVTKTTPFTGETTALGGNMFQCQEERSKATQFQSTMEALERYIAKEYYTDVNMSSLFVGKGIVQPRIVRPERPVFKEVVIKSEEGKEKTKEAIDFETNLLLEMKVLEEYKSDLEAARKAERKLQAVLQGLFATIMGQCSHTMRMKLERNEKLKNWKENHLCDKLLHVLEIRKISTKYDTQQNAAIMITQKTKELVNMRQEPNQSLHSFFQHFNLAADNIEKCHGTVGYHKVIQDEIEAKAKTDPKF